MSGPKRALFVQSIDDQALEFARQNGFSTLVESRSRAGCSSLDGIHAIGAGASSHVLDDAIWRSASGMCARWAAKLPISDPIRTCVRQIWLSEVVAPLLAAASEGADVLAGATPTAGDAAFVERGLSGDVFAAAVGLPKLNPVLPTVHRRYRRTVGPLPKPVDVLLVELFGYRLVNLSPVALEFQKRGLRVGFLSLARSPSEEAAHRDWAEEHGVRYHSWRWWAMAASATVGLQSATLAPALFKLTRRDVPADIDAFLGAPSSKLVHRAAGRALGQRALKSIATYHLFGSALKMLRPRAVFTCRGDGPTLRALSLAGCNADIPVVDVQHGRQNLLPPAGVAEIEHAHFAFASDHAGVVYREQGVPAQNIHLVGSVGFDAVMRSGREPAPYEFPYCVFSSCAATSTNVDEWNEATRVAAGAEPPAVQHHAALRALDRFLDANPDDHVIVVLHPRENGAHTRELVAALANHDRFVVLDRAHNGPLFAHARFHLSLGSTTSLEATLVGTPAVIIEPAGHASYFDRAIETGSMQRVSLLSDLDGALQRAANSEPERDAVVASYAVSDDLKTVERLFEIPPLRGRL